MYHAESELRQHQEAVSAADCVHLRRAGRGTFSKLKACPYCMPTPRKEFLEEINRSHVNTSPGEVMRVYLEKKQNTENKKKKGK